DSDHRLGRAIGTRVSAEVYNQVLSQGQQWVDRAYVYDAWYITAYQPIKDQYDNVIGMLYTGYLMWPFVKAYMTNIAEISLITLMLLLVSGVMVYRGSRDLFRPIERIHKVVKLVQLGKEKRIGPLGLDDHHELAHAMVKHCQVVEDQSALREQLEAHNLVAFVANGSVLPRIAGNCDLPMKEAVEFTAPESLQVTLHAPNK
ncbi:ABC-ATPase domain-containing protein, partial [Vibrio sp. 2094]|uniref:P-loop domain-containing protein n=1 Tax=Vibrio sp. 2094 TaxID=3074594 RepID=UPI0029664975